MGRPERFAIVGAGIGGLTAAIALQRKGFDVTIFEAASSIEPVGAGLALAANAIKGFSEIGIADAVLRAGSVLRKVKIKDDRGNVLAETDSEKLSEKYKTVNNFTIHRGDLHQVLLQYIDPSRLNVNHVCVDFVQDSFGVTLNFQDGNSQKFDYVIACDGIHSVIRKKLLPASTPRYAGYTCWRGVINNVPPTVDMNETTETWGRGKRFGIAPVNNNRLYWFACINANQNDPVMRKFNVADLVKAFEEFHSPVPEILRHTSDADLIWNDIIDLEPIEKFAFERIVLLGDAAHATTPNMGQGACLAIEDAVVLSNCLANSQSVESGFVNFEKKRIARTTTIVNQSWRLGRIAQWNNAILTRFRNMLLRLTPASVTEHQIKFILNVDLK